MTHDGPARVHLSSKKQKGAPMDIHIMLSLSGTCHSKELDLVSSFSNHVRYLHYLDIIILLSSFSYFSLLGFIRRSFSIFHRPSSRHHRFFCLGIRPTGHRKSSTSLAARNLASITASYKKKQLQHSFIQDVILVFFGLVLLQINDAFAFATKYKFMLVFYIITA